MSIGYPTLSIKNLLVDLSSHSVEQQYHENPQNKCILGSTIE
jgi:hypothetical protein